MHLLPPPDRRQLLLPMLLVAAMVPIWTNGWGLESEASARFERVPLPEGSTFVSAQFSVSFVA